MALRALLWRTQLELHLSRAAAQRAMIEQHNAHLTAWMRAAAVPSSPRETELLARPLGGWTQDEIAETVWRNDAAAPLLWLLEQAPWIPPYTVVVPASAVMARMDQLVHLRDLPTSRHESDISHALELALLWNWRARTEAFRRQGIPAPAGDSYEAAIERATRAAIDSNLVAAEDVADGDLLVGAGTRYSAADDARRLQLACVAHERHWALTWFADPATAWDSVNPAT